MSKSQIGTKVDEPIADALEKMEDAEQLEYTSDATRRALRTGLSELGYLSDGIGITPARRYAREMAKSLLYIAATLFALSAISPLAYFGASIGVSVGAILTLAIDRWVLTRVEPAVTNRIPRVEVSRRGNTK